MAIRPRRSVLYMPGANARALDKARSLPADALILDLEDAVAPDAKPMARQQIAAALRQGGYGRREIGVRINGFNTPWMGDDIAAVAALAPDAIVLPKAESAADIDRLTDALRRAGAPERTRIWAMIETPIAILRLPEIAGAARHAGSRLGCLIIGLNDLVKATRAELDANRTAALSWLSAGVVAARAHGLDILDSAYNNFRDDAGLRAECRQGRMLGFDGKTLIHPDQISAANEIFAPPAADVAWARAVIAAFALPENQGKGVINLEGKMVELLHAESARRTVAMADAISTLQ
ncbi:MAG: HpcH/HpaI aldolase/citrate lyase family protein [Hyphomicrobiaceae bacterium]